MENLVDQPGRRSPAPGALAQVQAFVNSADFELGTDDLGDADAAQRWLESRGVRIGRVGPGELERLVRVREALRSLLGAHAGGAIDPSLVRELDELLSTALLRPAVSANGGALLAAAPGIDGFLGTLTAAIVTATADGSWERLKACAQDSCRWAYYDHSKNGRGVWCTMRVCGSRAKSRAYRARQRREAGAASERV